MADKYKCFALLEACEVRGIDYDVQIQQRDSPVVIIAPHGGRIELHTTLIAEKTAGSQYNFYSFIGLKQAHPFEFLHITSTHFDEPCCLALIAKCDVVIAIHGRKDRDDPDTISMGGLDISLRMAIAGNLRASGFAAGAASGRLAGGKAENICNRGRSKMGVQLELPLTLRKSLQAEPNRMSKFAQAVSAAIESRH
jgi:phage replication-related protein YjqB (UPF0714/DUF867 family)